jgi:hypothetical protein
MRTLLYSLFVTLSVAGTLAAQSTIGQFESHQDIGVTPAAGSAQFEPASGEYRVTGGGANLWGPQDAFQFVWKQVSGDVRITADVRFIGAGAVAHRKALLMIRQSLAPDAAYADVALHGDGLTALQFRSAAGATTEELRSTVSAPTRIRIERRGNQFTIFAGKPGEELTPTGPQTVALADPVYLGLGVCSHDENILESAVFSNVQIEPLPRVAARPRYRSKVTIFDTATRQGETVYTQDDIVEAPNWSRDGKYLLVNTGGNLYRLPVSGAGPAKLEKIDLGAGGYRCNNDHDLSRDGKWLAFSASTPASRQSQVFLAGGDGSGAKLVVETAPSYFHGWSPDSKWLAIVGQRNGKFELYRVPVTGGPEERLTSKGAYDDGPEYSPDGKWIYFNSNRSGGWDIWRMPPEGAGAGDATAQQVTNDELEDWFPHFSPNGKWVVFLSFPKGVKTHDEKMDGVSLRLMPAPGKQLKPAKIEVLTTFYGGQGTINVNSWSPDSKKFAFVVYEPLPAQQ